MNRSSFALFVALLIHVIFLLLFWVLGSITPEVKKVKKQEQRMKISLKELPKTSKKSGITKKVKPPKDTTAPPMPKGKQLKKVVKPNRKSVKKITKQPKIKYEPKKVTKPVKKQPINKPKNKPKPKPVPRTKPIPSNKPYVPLKPKEADPLAWMKKDKSEEEKKSSKSKENIQSSSIGRNIMELYGEEFGKLTPGQQQYIIDNQEIMRRITQQVLTRLARVNLPRDINVNRTNVIEFYLHPNGDMTDFKFLKKSGYYVLDDTTEETIKYAYSKYPHPSEKTLIRYNVFYNLAHY